MKKDMENKMLFGVCSGLANHLQLDVTLLRAGFVIGTLMGFGFPIIIYVVLALVMQE